MKPTALLFDLDGVLIDSERQYTRIWADVDRTVYHTGVKDFPLAIKGMTLANILATYFPENMHKRVSDFCITEERKLHFGYMPGARELLAELKRREIPAVLVTSSDLAKMNRLQEVLPDIFQWFSHIVYGEMVEHGKPAPDPYLLGAGLSGVPASDCAVIEDSLSGLESGRAAGAYLIGMTDTLGRKAIEGHADIVLDSLEDLDLDLLLNTLENR